MAVVPSGVANQGNFSADLDTDDNTLVLQFDSSSRPEMAIINGVFRNDFYPYDIRSANVSLDVTFKEDDCRVRNDTSALNLSWIRKMRLNGFRIPL